MIFLSKKQYFDTFFVARNTASLTYHSSHAEDVLIFCLRKNRHFSYGQKYQGHAGKISTFSPSKIEILPQIIMSKFSCESHERAAALFTHAANYSSIRNSFLRIHRDQRTILGNDKVHINVDRCSIISLPPYIIVSGLDVKMQGVLSMKALFLSS